MARDYKLEYARDHAGPRDKKNRAARNAARADAMKEGRVRKGDDMEVDHVRPLSKGGSNAPSNRRVVTRATNRKKGVS
jgi:5-methylcytosine-specific restriction endonuclease McrA